LSFLPRSIRVVLPVLLSALLSVCLPSCAPCVHTYLNRATPETQLIWYCRFRPAVTKVHQSICSRSPLRKQVSGHLVEWTFGLSKNQWYVVGLLKEAIKGINYALYTPVPKLWYLKDHCFAHSVMPSFPKYALLVISVCMSSSYRTFQLLLFA
jgi:hypothetical protein